MGEMIDVARSSVQTWQSDQMGHMNVQFYMEQATQGLAALGVHLGLGPRFSAAEGARLAARTHHVRFLREQRPGAPFTIRAGVLDVRDFGLTVYEEMTNTVSGEVAATFTGEVELLDEDSREIKPLPARARTAAKALLMELPAHGAPRGLQIQPPRPAPTLKEAEALGLVYTWMGEIQPGQCDAQGFLHTRHFMGIVSDSIPNLLGQMRGDDRSKAMRHAFLAERQSAVRIKTAKPVEVRSVAVIGGGTMGAGIAMSFANAGISATIVESDEAAAGRAAERVAGTYDHSVRRGSLDESARQERLDRIGVSAGMSGAAGADLVIEAVFEDMGVKKQVFAELEAAARADAVLATNTSYLDLDEIAASTGHPERVVGMHFFSPANVMKLVEVVRGRATSEAALATALAAARAIGKIPVVVRNCHGFVGNRMLARRSEQMDRLLLEGALPDEVDLALTGFGFRMGPCAMSDLAGLDIGWRMRRATGRTAPAADALVEAGRLGQKTGKGYFLYPDGRKRSSTRMSRRS